MFLARLVVGLGHSFPRWRIVSRNIRRGTKSGLHTTSDLTLFAEKLGIEDQLSDNLSGAKASDDVLRAISRNEVRRRRYSGPGSIHTEQRRINAVSSEFPCAYHNAVDLNSTILYRIVSHTSLIQMIDPDFWRRPEIVDLDLMPLPPHVVGGTPSQDDEIAEWCAALGGLPPHLRRFPIVINGTLSNGIVWFTREGDIPASWSTAPSPANAHDARNLLGLSHLPHVGRSRMWLFGLRFSGAVAQAVGHYRPSTLDALDSNRFMVPPTSLSSGEWGRTASLSAIIDASRNILGVPERVANQILDSDLGGAELGFDFIGEINTAPPGSDALFADRLDAIA